MGASLEKAVPYLCSGWFGRQSCAEVLLVEAEQGFIGYLDSPTRNRIGHPIKAYIHPGIRVDMKSIHLKRSDWGYLSNISTFVKYGDK